MTNPRPDISKFKNYRPFLKAMFAYKKSKNPRFSFQVLAQKMGTSPSLMKHVLGARKNISIDRISDAAKAFELDEFESDYFTIQVIHNLTRSSATRKYLSLVMGGLLYQKETKSAHYKTLRTVAGAYLNGNWLAATIHQLAKFQGFKGDPQWIRDQLVDGAAVSTNEIEVVMKNLIELDLIEKPPDGRMSAKPEPHGGADPYSKNSLKIYREFIGKTYDVLADPEKYKTCQFFVSAFAVDAAGEEEIIAQFEAFRENATIIAAKRKNPDRVIMLTNSLFNLVKK